MAEEQNHVSYKKSGSRILWQITILVLVVFIISASLTWIFYWRSTDDLIEESKEEIIMTEAGNMSSTYGFIIDLIAGKFEDELNLTAEEQVDVLMGLTTGKISKIQADINDMMIDMIEAGTLGMQEAFVVLPGGTPLAKNDTIVIGSDTDRIYEEVPNNIQTIYDGSERYLFLENGIPEWGLEDEYLVVYEAVVFGSTGQDVLATAIKSMHVEMERINSFYKSKQRRINIIMSAVIACSLLLLFVVTFFVLRHLIRSRITKPIDELSEAAEQVMEGDLDVEIEISKGEEFEGLKRAFVNMLESIRDIMSRATGE